jgi:hypothetical protein
MKKICTCFITITLTLPYFAYAQGVYQVPDEFMNEVFDHDPPKSKKLWLRKLLKEEVKSIMGHDLGVLRLRYWYKDDRSAWILEEIGKERPITTGIVVNKNKIELVRILIFRESRGWEVRHPFFTDQFKDANLMQENKLDRSIDGISGATLSVKAVTKLARLALMLNRYVTGSE